MHERSIRLNVGRMILVTVGFFVICSPLVSVDAATLSATRISQSVGLRGGLYDKLNVDFGSERSSSLGTVELPSFSLRNSSSFATGSVSQRVTATPTSFLLSGQSTVFSGGREKAIAYSGFNFHIDIIPGPGESIGDPITAYVHYRTFHRMIGLQEGPNGNFDVFWIDGDGQFDKVLAREATSYEIQTTIGAGRAGCCGDIEIFGKHNTGSGDTFGNRGFLTQSYFAEVSLSPTPSEFPPLPVPGDVNGDGVVDAADLAILLANWGQEVPLAQGNVDGFGTVNETDLDLLFATWTVPMADGDQSASVPEPSTLTLAALGLLGLLGCGRRRRQQAA